MMTKTFFYSKFLVVSFLFLLITACSSNENDATSENPSGLNQDQRYKVEEEHEAFVAQVDLNDSLNVINSLLFTHEDGSQIDVAGFLDKKGEVVKLIEKSVDGPTNFYKQIMYYVKNGRKYISNERFTDTTQQENPSFVERITYYDENEKPIISKEKRAKYEEELGMSQYDYIKPIDCSITRALQVINQEGRFQTKFQGLVYSGKDVYITVGEEDGYISALLIQYDSETTKKMKKNQKEMLGKVLDLNFQRVMDDNGFQFQLLLVVNEKETKKEDKN